MHGPVPICTHISPLDSAPPVSNRNSIATNPLPRLSYICMLIQCAIVAVHVCRSNIKNTNINMFSFLRLRVRIKALQQTIDTQSVRITDLISSQVLASMNGRDSEENAIFVVYLHVHLQFSKFMSQCNEE